MDFSKWRQEILHEIEYIVFHNYFVFLEKTLLMYRCLLPSSATIQLDNEENMEGWRFGLITGDFLSTYLMHVFIVN
jgi:hypothetical protein